MIKQKNGWISVEEQLPPIEQTILLCVLVENTQFIISGWSYIDDDGERHFTNGEENLITTHWQPLPNPPTT